MTDVGFEIYPSINEIRDKGLKDGETIVMRTHIAAGHVKGEKRKGMETKPGVTYQSKWKPVFVEKAIDYVDGLLRTPYHDEPLLQKDIPKRHIREAGHVGRILFKVQRFKRLRLYGPFNQYEIVVVLAGKMADVFLTQDDAEIWHYRRTKQDCEIRILPVSVIQEKIIPNVTEHELIERAQQRSAEMRYELRRDLLKTHHACRSIENLKDMLKCGFKIHHLQTHYSAMFPRYPFELIIKPVLGLG
jgi:hypothetical protein